VPDGPADTLIDSAHAEVLRRQPDPTRPD
jgi:hypothetical protein